MKIFKINKVNESIREAIQHKIDNLNKPKGSLGRLESLAMQICLIQQRTSPTLHTPCHLLLGADHGIEREHISVSPREITWQQMIDLSIVYTPLHGTGMTLIPRSLKLWGFENVNCVPEQMIKDGNFSTVVSPNPENAEALTLAIDLAKKINADIVMASDPDADRVGMACKNDKGEWVLINGNQTCLIFLYYIITNRKKLGKMKGDEFIVKTIVTTESEFERAEAVEFHTF